MIPTCAERGKKLESQSKKRGEFHYSGGRGVASYAGGGGKTSNQVQGRVGSA